MNAWKIQSLDTKIADPIMYPFAHTAYMASMYLTVLLTLVRYLAVCRKRNFTFKETKISMASIFLLAIIYNVPKWMMFRWETNLDDVRELKITELFCDPTFYKVYYAGGNEWTLHVHFTNVDVDHTKCFNSKGGTNCRYY